MDVYEREIIRLKTLYDKVPTPDVCEIFESEDERAQDIISKHDTDTEQEELDEDSNQSDTASTSSESLYFYGSDGIKPRPKSSNKAAKKHYSVDYNAIINDLQLEIISLKKYNYSLKKQIEDNLNESTSMESSLTKENSKLQLLVFNLKMEIKNLRKENQEILDKVESEAVRSNSNVKRKNKSIQTEKNCNDTAIQTAYKTVSSYIQTDLNINDVTTQVKVKSTKKQHKSSFDKRKETGEPLSQSECNSIINICTSTAADKKSDKSLFMELAEANIDAPAADTPGANMKARVNHNKSPATKKQSVLILGDSQARNMGGILKSLLNTSAIEVLNIFKPNGLLEDIICDVKRFTRDFTPYDFVVVMEGSNNAFNGVKLDTRRVANALRELKSRLNLVVMSTPFVRNYNYKNVNKTAMALTNITARTAVTVEEFLLAQENITGNGSFLNGSVSLPHYPSGYTLPQIVVASIVVTILMIVVVVGNMLVIIAITTEKALKNIQNWFIASLAVADFFLGLVIMPFSLANELMGYWIFGAWWCDVHSAMDVLLSTASIMNLCLISLDRYWSITQAVEYLKKRTPGRAVLMIAIVWVVSALICIPPLLGWKVERPPDEQYPKCQLENL
ncbi:hypothetical protein RN001_011709 [Aquatica leii]|uniref:G-protein coupled receptors family 1 profile domain-containing protein n=1 Tax=Aquatica leii TaxID=1421715 RepID=A0AAN7PT98_9COLE|nr:hypothetical protein RN001_011709 [Aquatica leii]